MCRTGLILLLILSVVGCGTQVRPAASAGAAADNLRQRLGMAQTVVASLLVQIVPDQGDIELFTLRLWSTADQAIRLRVLKLDVAILDALVQPDGTYEAVLVRERVATRGTLGAPDDPQLLRDLRLLMDELRHGPIPAGVLVADGAWTWADPTGWQAQLSMGPDGLPGSKVLLDGETEMRHLVYQRWQTYEGLQRPSQVELRAFGDPSTIRMRVKHLDDPGTVSAERMALSVPVDAERVAPDEFARRMPH
jgi:hypothetical protein